MQNTLINIAFSNNLVARDVHQYMYGLQSVAKLDCFSSGGRSCAESPLYIPRKSRGGTRTWEGGGLPFSSHVISAAEEIVVEAFLSCSKTSRESCTAVYRTILQLKVSYCYRCLPTDPAKLPCDLTGRPLASCKHACFRARLYAIGRQVQ